MKRRPYARDLRHRIDQLGARASGRPAAPGRSPPLRVARATWSASASNTSSDSSSRSTSSASMVRFMLARAACSHSAPARAAPARRRPARAARLVARVQRAELDGDAVGGHRRWRAAARRDAPDGVLVARQVAQCVLLGARAFAQHVVAEAEVRLQLLARRGGLVHAPRSMVWPSTNWRPSSWTARSVAATTVRAPSRAIRPGSCAAEHLGQEFLGQGDGAGRQPGQRGIVRLRHRSRRGPAGPPSAQWRSRRRAHAAGLRPGASAPGLRRWRSGIP
jgi:hypothetical protein